MKITPPASHFRREQSVLLFKASKSHSNC